MISALQGSSPIVLLTRLVVSAIVVLTTYNPTGTSLVHWILEHENRLDAWVVLAGIVAAVLNLVLLIAAWKALGMLGTVLVAIFFAALVYLSLQEGWVTTGNMASIQWLGLILYIGFLAIGLSGAIIWRRATGQIVTDEAPDVND